MSVWTDLVKKHFKNNPGKSLKEVMPMVQAEYNKTGKISHKKKGSTKRVRHKKRHRKRHHGGSNCSTANIDANSSPLTESQNHTDSGPVAYDSNAYENNAYGSNALNNNIIGGKHHKRRKHSSKHRRKRHRRGKRSMKKYRGRD